MADNSARARITGLRLSGSSDGLSVNCSTGFAFLPDGTRLAYGGGSASLVDPVAGPSWRHAYLKKTTPGNYAQLILSTVGPDTPYLDSARTMTGDDSARYLGSGLVQSNRLRPARHITVGGYGNLIMFGQASSVLNTPYQLLAIGTASLAGTGAELRTLRTIDLQNAVPVTADTAIIQINNQSNGWVYGNNPDIAPASPTARQLEIQPNNAIQFPAVQLSAARTLSVVGSPVSVLGVNLVSDLLHAGNYQVSIHGYYFNR